MQGVYTTGQVAKLCHISPNHVRRCMDNGLLKGFRVPGGKDRRFTPQQIVKFCHDHGIPVHPELLRACGGSVVGGGDNPGDTTANKEVR